jgi:hypothetical protein
MVTTPVAAVTAWMLFSVAIAAMGHLDRHPSPDAQVYVRAAQHGDFVAVVAALVWLGAGLRVVWRRYRRRDPSDGRSWAQRAEAQRRTAVVLETLSSQGWVVLNDRQLFGTDLGVEHLAIGPSGICLIGSLRTSGTVRLDLTGTLICSARGPLPAAALDTLAKAAGELSAALEAIPAVARTGVCAVLAVHGAKVRAEGYRLGDTNVLSADRLVPWMALSEMVMSPGDVVTVARAAAAVLLEPCPPVLPSAPQLFALPTPVELGNPDRA